jgi:DTW domain-containing protein YfiP
MPLEWWIVQGYNAGFRYNWQKTSFDVAMNDRFTEPVVQVYIAFQKGGLDLEPSVGRY